MTNEMGIAVKKLDELREKMCELDKAMEKAEEQETAFLALAKENRALKKEYRSIYKELIAGTNTLMIGKWKRCPFCGSDNIKVILYETAGGDAIAICGSCGSSTGCYEYPAEAAQAWNNRAGKEINESCGT